MKNGIMVSVVIVLLVGSSAIGQITQSKLWNLSLTNDMTAGGGVSNDTASHWVSLWSSQSAGINPDPNGDPTVTADQGVIGGLYQEGTVNTNGATATLGQSLTLDGIPLSLMNPAGQTQTVGDLNGPIEQYEGTTLAGSQDLEKGQGSTATVSALNAGGLGMGQVAVNTCGEGTQMSLIAGGQSSTVNGGAQGTAEVHMEMSGEVEQIQLIND